jgi:branched-chain amino acid aminotransferase
MAFSLATYPVVYRAQFVKQKWKGEYLEKPHKTPQAEAKMSAAQREALIASRNYYEDMPLVNYTSQYGLSCFEGLKALPQKDGGLSLFRPDQNAARFFRSMKGLYMPPFPEDLFVKAAVETVKRNAKLGFRMYYKKEWEKDSFMSADSIYMRPFVYSEGGIGVNISKQPSVMIVTTPVSAYFSGDIDAAAVITDRFRATPNGTGWIKAASNYTIAALAKHEAVEAGFMECIFLDSVDRKYVEEGSSCNIFFYLNSGELVTPELGDTILPGITRASIIELARDRKIKVSERKIAIEEALAEAKECFVCGTAAGAVPIMSLTYKKKKTVFNKGKIGELTAELRDTIKGIQYGAIPDTKGWMRKVPV